MVCISIILAVRHADFQASHPMPAPPGSSPGCKPSIGASGAPITGPLPLQPYLPAPTLPSTVSPALYCSNSGHTTPNFPLRLTSLYDQRQNANSTPLSPISSTSAPRRTIDAPLTPLPLRQVRAYHKPPALHLLLLLARAPAPANALVLLPLDCRTPG